MYSEREGRGGGTEGNMRISKYGSRERQNGREKEWKQDRKKRIKEEKKEKD